MSASTKITGKKTIQDWIDLRSKIDSSQDDKGLWEEAFDEFLYNRIETRYLNPIKAIGELKDYLGEGFSIATIQCSLIEFLETTITGETYQLRSPDPHKFEYKNSKAKFIHFLESRPPFDGVFDHNSAKGFYENVRCGLVHEAQTKGKWLVRVDNVTDLIETKANGTIVYDTDKFQTLLEVFLKKYKENLMNDPNLQAALRRKMNVICRLPITD